MGDAALRSDDPSLASYASDEVLSAGYKVQYPGAILAKQSHLSTQRGA